MSIAIRLISVFVTLAVCSPATGASARRWLRRSRRAGARGGPQGTLGAAPAGAGRRAGHARPLRPREALERAADEAHVGDAGRRARVEAAHRVHVARSPAHHEEEEGVATNTLYPYQPPWISLYYQGTPPSRSDGMHSVSHALSRYTCATHAPPAICTRSQRRCTPLGLPMAALHALCQRRCRAMHRLTLRPHGTGSATRSSTPRGSSLGARSPRRSSPCNISACPP